MMKTHYTEKYYRNEMVQDKIKKSRRAMNLEKELERELSFIDFEEFKEEEREKVKEALTKFYAKKVYDRAKEKLLEDKKLYLSVIKDSNCLGYTTKLQEIAAKGEIIEAFEYNCLMLRDFRNKYFLK